MREIEARALDRGFKPLAQVGIDRILDGTTSIDEVARVVDMTGRVQ
jgi:type II secretory ATPase GspE/PulE/Tfp pilus assembly ATPase PilB-like protein